MYRRGTNDSLKCPDDYLQIQLFRSLCTNLQLKHSLSPFQVTNMDQTMCRFDMVPHEANKKGFTVVEESFQPFLFSKNPLGPRVEKNLMIPGNVRVQASTNVWMTTQLYLWWHKNIYCLDEVNQWQLRRLLVVDQYRPHITAESRTAVEMTNND